MSELTFLQRLVAKMIITLFFMWIIFLLLFQKLRFWFTGRADYPGFPDYARSFSFSDLRLKKIRNESVITRVIPSANDLSGFPMKIQVSSLSSSQCFILENVPITDLHDALLDDYRALIVFLKLRCVETRELHVGTEELTLKLQNPPIPCNPKGSKRNHYSAVIGLVSSADQASTETIVVSCYVIHVRLCTEELVDTCLLYTFWKTNWDRLLTPQAMYAARDDQPIGETSSSSWNPSCFICFSVADSGLRILLPCRHGGMCPECFKAFQDKLFARTSDPLASILCCPLCRTPVNAVLCLPPPSDRPQSQTQQQQQ